MTDSTNAETIVPGNGLGALVTTGLVSAIAAFSATLLYFHYFPPVVEKPAPIAVVDMVKLGMAVTKMSGEGDASAFMNTGRAIGERQKFCVHGIIGARQTGASNEHEHQTQFS